MLLFLIWNILTLFWSPEPVTGLVEVLRLCTFLGLALFASQWLDTENSLRWSMPSILAGAGIALLIGILQYFDLDPFSFRRAPSHIPSTFINRNHAANYFDFIPPLALSGILLFHRALLSRFSALVFGLGVIYILLNSSRGGWLALATWSSLTLILLTCLPKLRKETLALARQKKGALLIAVCVPVCFFILLKLLNFSPPAGETSRLELMDHSGELRIAMYVNALPAIADHPLTGLGIGGMRLGFLPYASAILPTDFRTEDTILRELHNDPLQNFVEFGLPGGLLFLLIAFSLYRTGLKHLASSASLQNRILSLTLLTGLGASLIHSIVDFPLRLPASGAMFWLYAGWLLALSGMARTKHEAESTPPRLLHSSLMFAGLLGLLSGFLLYPRYLSANHFLYQAAYNLQTNHCRKAAEAATSGIDRFPFDFMLWTALAQTYTACSFPHGQKREIMQSIITRDPANLRARSTMGFLLLDEGKPKEAIPLFEGVARTLPHRATSYAGLGDAYLELGQPQRARQFYKAALRNNPQYNYVIMRLRSLENQ